MSPKQKLGGCSTKCDSPNNDVAAVGIGGGHSAANAAAIVSCTVLACTAVAELAHLEV
jgi:hypothetical protein